MDGPHHVLVAGDGGVRMSWSRWRSTVIAAADPVLTTCRERGFVNDDLEGLAFHPERARETGAGAQSRGRAGSRGRQARSAVVRSDSGGPVRRRGAVGGCGRLGGCRGPRWWRAVLVTGPRRCATWSSWESARAAGDHEPTPAEMTRKSLSLLSGRGQPGVLPAGGGGADRRAVARRRPRPRARGGQGLRRRRGRRPTRQRGRGQPRQQRHPRPPTPPTPPARASPTPPGLPALSAPPPSAPPTTPPTSPTAVPGPVCGSPPSPPPTPAPTSPRAPSAPPPSATPRSGQHRPPPRDPRRPARQRLNRGGPRRFHNLVVGISKTAYVPATPRRLDWRHDPQRTGTDSGRPHPIACALAFCRHSGNGNHGLRV